MSGVPAAQRRLARYFGNGGLTTWEYKKLAQHVDDVRTVLEAGGELHANDKMWVSGGCSEEANLKVCSQECEAFILQRFGKVATEDVLVGLVFFPEACHKLLDIPPFMKLSHAGTTIASGPAAVGLKRIPTYEVERTRGWSSGSGGAGFFPTSSSGMLVFAAVVVAVVAYLLRQPLSAWLSSLGGSSGKPRGSPNFSMGGYEQPYHHSSASLSQTGQGWGHPGGGITRRNNSFGQAPSGGMPSGVTVLAGGYGQSGGSASRSSGSKTRGRY